MLKKYTDAIFQFGYWIILILSGIPLLFLAIQSLWGQTYIPLRIAENVEFTTNPWYFIPLLLLSLLFLISLEKVTENIPEKWLFLACSLLYICGGIYLISQYNGVIRADAKHVFKAALAFNQGDYSSLTTIGSYMYRNPHQLGLLTLERLYALISPTTQFIFVINLGMVLAINFFLYKMTQQLWKNSRVNRFCIFLSFLFLPQFFFILFAYGTTPGLLACLISLYFFYSFHQEKKWWQLLIGTLAISIACLLRNNYLLFAIMLGGVECLSCFQNWSFRRPLVIFCIFTGIFLSGRALTSYYEDVTGRIIGEGTPKISYITMGLRDDPDRQTLGGWYDAYNTKILKRNNYDEKKARKMATKDLQQLLAHFIQNPDYARKFFYEKVRSTWTEPTFQSIWTGPQLERNQYTYTPLLQSIYEEKEGYHLFYLYTGIFLTLVYLGSLAFLVSTILGKETGVTPYHFYALIFFVGGFSFHFFWETKSQYVYIYILLLIPLLANRLAALSHLLNRKYEKRQ